MRLLASLLGALGCASPGGAGKAATGPAVGDFAPDFDLSGSDGHRYKLAELRGQAVVIAWFPKAFTGGCTIECRSLRESGDELRKFQVAHFAASVDDVDTNRRFSESLKLDYPILCDPDRKAAQAFGVVTKPDGLAKRWTFIIGPDGRVLHVDRDVGVMGHGRALAQRLADLGVARR